VAFNGRFKAASATEQSTRLSPLRRGYFAKRGVDGVGLNELMREAGFTQGGFYNHFKSKDALVAEVVAAAVTGANDKLSQAIAKTT